MKRLSTHVNFITKKTDLILHTGHLVQPGDVNRRHTAGVRITYYLLLALVVLVVAVLFAV
jgi:hypothetical protein